MRFHAADLSAVSLRPGSAGLPPASIWQRLLPAHLLVSGLIACSLFLSLSATSVQALPFLKKKTNAAADTTPTSLPADKAVQAELDKGARQIQNKDYKNALITYKAIFLERPFDPNVLLGIALAAERCGDLDQALKYARQATTCAPSDPQTHIALGGYLEENRDLKAAYLQYSRVLELNPPKETLDHVFGPMLRILMNINETAEAEKLSRKWAKDFPAEPDCQYNNGWVLSQCGADKLPDAVASYQAALKLSPDMVGTHYNLALLFLKLKQNDQAYSELTQFLKLAPNDADAAHAKELIDKLKGKTATNSQQPSNSDTTKTENQVSGTDSAKATNQPPATDPTTAATDSTKPVNEPSGTDSTKPVIQPSNSDQTPATNGNQVKGGDGSGNLQPDDRSTKSMNDDSATDKYKPADGAELIGTKAPEFSGLQWLGKPYTLAKLHGKVVLIRFWLADCPMCQNSAPALNTLYKRYGDKGLVVIGIHHPKSPLVRQSKVVEQAAKSYGFTFPIAIDNDWLTINSLWLHGQKHAFTSASLLIDQNGVIRWVHPGGELLLSDKNSEKSETAFASLDNEIQRLLALGSGPPK